MAKYRGRIGFNIQKEEPEGSGIWIDEIEERYYSGDLLRNNAKWSSGMSVNDNLNITNQFSILADAYAYKNFHSMKYIEYMGSLWKIDSADASQRPRIILTVGGLWNGEQNGTSGGA